MGSSCLTRVSDKVIADEKGIKDSWKEYVEKLMNEENEWDVILPTYRGRGDLTECRSYRGIKLFEHAMKVVERIFKYRIRQQIDIDDMQFGFMKGVETTVRTVYGNGNCLR